MRTIWLVLLLIVSGAISCSEASVPQSTQNSFKQVQKAITGTFDTDHLEIIMVRCGGANAYATSTQVLVCLEYVEQLRSELTGNSETYSTLILFTLMHEVGHILLHSWHLPGRQNEENIDEFAMVLMMMFNQTQKMNAVADYFDDKSAGTTDSPVYPAGNHHPSYGLRAKNIRHWLKNPEFAHKWQKHTVPHIRTAVLEDLLARPRSWSDSKLIGDELKSRQSKPDQNSADT